MEISFLDFYRRYALVSESNFPTAIQWLASSKEQKGADSR
jgi:hypothetical protein